MGSAGGVTHGATDGVTRRDRQESWPQAMKSVTRLCRCEPLLSDQSNKWDELQQVRLSARGGLAQFWPQALMSRGISNKARGNPARLSNTAGDAGSTLH